MAERRDTFVPPATRCGHQAALAEALGLPRQDLPRLHSRQYWDELLDRVRTDPECKETAETLHSRRQNARELERPDGGTLAERIAWRVEQECWTAAKTGAFDAGKFVDAVMEHVGPLVERLHQAAASARDSAAYAEQGWTEVERLRAELAEARAALDERPTEEDWNGLVHNHRQVLAAGTTLVEQKDLLLWLHAEAAWQRDEAIDVLADLADDSPCVYDHHGYCQGHGWLYDSPCPQKRLRDFAARGGTAEEGRSR